MRSQTETPKRYRYTGKERDEESGLNYHGARYYAPWLSRWLSPDPAGVATGPNRYLYGFGSPVRYSDPNGREPDEGDTEPPVSMRLTKSGPAPVRASRKIETSLDWSSLSTHGGRQPFTDKQIYQSLEKSDAEAREHEHTVIKDRLQGRHAKFRSRNAKLDETIPEAAALNDSRLSETELNNIDMALEKVTKDNPQLLGAYYLHYGNHNLARKTPEKGRLGDTEWGDTTIHPLVLALKERKEGIKDTDDLLSLLASTLLHEYVHTSQGGGHDPITKWPLEAKAYGIESFFAGRMGDKTRENKATEKGTDYDRKIFNESERTIWALYEVIENGNPKDADQARQLSVEFISRTDKDYSRELNAFRAKLFSQTTK